MIKIKWSRVTERWGNITQGGREVMRTTLAQITLPEADMKTEVCMQEACWGTLGGSGPYGE